MSVGGPICPKRHSRLYGADFVFGGLKQAHGAASPAASLGFPASFSNCIARPA